jgi:hypothetical protein
VAKEIAESTDELKITVKPLPVAQNVEVEILEKPERLQRQKLRQAQSRGIGI